MLRKLGFQKYFVSFRCLFQNPQHPDLQQSRHLNLELLERRLLISCDTYFTGGVLTITCGAEDDSISVRIDAGGALILNEVAITGAPSASNTDEIVIAAGGVAIRLPSIKVPVPWARVLPMKHRASQKSKSPSMPVQVPIP